MLFKLGFLPRVNVPVSVIMLQELSNYSATAEMSSDLLSVSFLPDRLQECTSAQYASLEARAMLVPCAEPSAHIALLKQIGSHAGITRCASTIQ